MAEFWSHYLEILTDPAHFLAEISFTVIIDLFVLGLIWPLTKRYVNKMVNKEHRKLDEEHGHPEHD